MGSEPVSRPALNREASCGIGATSNVLPRGGSRAGGPNARGHVMAFPAAAVICCRSKNVIRPNVTVWRISVPARPLPARLIAAVLIRWLRRARTSAPATRCGDQSTGTSTYDILFGYTTIQFRRLHNLYALRANCGYSVSHGGFLLSCVLIRVGEGLPQPISPDRCAGSAVNLR